jgi:hypothetical protein
LNGGASFFGVAVTAALLLTLAYTLSILGDRSAVLLSVAACMFLIGAELIFWLITYQINAITKQWTVAPDNFEIARKRWEYAEAISAIFTFLALVTILLSIEAAAPPNSVRTSPTVVAHVIPANDDPLPLGAEQSSQDNNTRITPFAATGTETSAASAAH